MVLTASEAIEFRFQLRHPYLHSSERSLSDFAALLRRPHTWRKAPQKQRKSRDTDAEANENQNEWPQPRKG